MKCQSCDTFVVLPPLTEIGIIFGKNSDRPGGEIQEIVFFPSTESTQDIMCTYIEVESSGTTKAVILSKPNWMWGAEMGANECGVVIGNEAVWTDDNEGEHDTRVKRLLGMDLVRLGLERSSNALEALAVITQLLEKYGQGGPCSYFDHNLTYHNSFLIADSQSAWVLETSGKHWVAEHILSGYRNISNELSITTKIDKHSDGIFEYAKRKGLWDGNGDFNFCKVFSGKDEPDSGRFVEGKKLLAKHSSANNFKQIDMFTILRDKNSDICRPCSGSFPSQSSQVSTLYTDKPNIHWFTGTPDPSQSIFKPFIFTRNPIVSKHTQCLSENVSEPHKLYFLQSEAVKHGKQVRAFLRNTENDIIKRIENEMDNTEDCLTKFDKLFKECVEKEMTCYQ